MRNLIVAAMVITCSAQAAAQMFDARLADAFSRIESGDYDGAVQEFNELKVDHPQSELIDYGLASALYAKAAHDYETGNREMAEVGMNAARKRFQDLRQSPQPEVSRDAQFGEANSLAIVARDKAREYIEKFPVVRPEDYKTAEETAGNAVRALEDYVARYPEDDRARTNLNHARYTLKSIQQRQPDQQQQQQSEGEDEGDQQQDQQSGDQGEEGGEDQEGEDEQESGDQGSEDQEEADADQGETDQSGAGAETRADMSQNELSRQNIEAILQSLEDINREEQKNLMRADTAPRTRDGQWW